LLKALVPTKRIFGIADKIGDMDMKGELDQKGDNLWGLFSGVTKYTTHSLSKGDNSENKMTITKDGEFESLGNTRHKLEVKLLEELLVAKDAELKDFEEKRGKVKADILAHKEYQDKLAEEANLRKDIEEMGVKLEMMQINVKELEDITDMLASKKDELIDAKKSAEMKNEELKKEAATKEELAQKRIQTKLNRAKNVEVKELIAQEETAV
jgi:hypothetical protein